MKPIILFSILMLFECSLSFGATVCKTVEYPDRNEIVCIGDEKAGPDTLVPVKPSQTAVAEKPAQRQVQTPNPTAAPVAAAVKPLQEPASSAPALQQANVPASKPDTAAEHLARRRVLAERNSRILMNQSSASSPQVK